MDEQATPLFGMSDVIDACEEAYAPGYLECARQMPFRILPQGGFRTAGP